MDQRRHSILRRWFRAFKNIGQARHIGDDGRVVASLPLRADHVTGRAAVQLAVRADAGQTLFESACHWHSGSWRLSLSSIQTHILTTPVHTPVTSPFVPELGHMLYRL